MAEQSAPVKQETESNASESIPELPSMRRARTISFEKNTRTEPMAVHKKPESLLPAPILKPQSSISQPPGGEEDGKTQALSNLRCPSPPPILNKPPASQLPMQQQLSKPPITLQQRSTTPQPPSILVLSNPGSPSGSSKAAEDPKSPMSLSSAGPSFLQLPTIPHKETVPAGGAILRGRAAAQAVVALVLAQTARNRHFRDSSNEDALSEVNLQINEEQFSHHKAPSIHAHFYVDETLRHGSVTLGSRSRSGSASTSESRNVLEPLQIDNLIKKTALLSTQSSVPLVTKQTVDARLPSDDNKLHVLFGICGTISTKKTRLMINKLEEIYGPDKISIQIIITSALEHFVSRGEFPNSIPIWRDKDEWTTWGGRSDPVLHIELRRWADIMVIAPLTSNTLSKIALGLCDNLLTNVVRAWNTQYPILVAPSMVSYAYNSPITKRHLKIIKEEMPWIEILKPTEKIVGSFGDIGMGGMMDWNEIVKRICLKANDMGFNDEEDEEDDDEEVDEEEKKNGEKEEEEIEDEDKEEEEEDDDDDDGIKLSVAEEDEIEKVLKQ